MKRHQYYLAMSILPLLCLSSTVSGQSTSPDLRKILKQTVAIYANCSSYQDSGLVRTIPGEQLLADSLSGPSFLDISFGDDTLASFKTYYARPRLFLFEWKSSVKPNSRSVAIWSSGKQAYRWAPAPYVEHGGFVFEKGSRLKSYIDEAKGTSGGASFFIPSLLMKDLDYIPFGEMLSSMNELSLVREEQVDGETCYAIKGTIYEVPWLLWIGKNSHLLRKMRTLYTSGSFDERVETGRMKTFIAEEVHRDIRINQKIPERAFNYRPQLQSGDIDLTR